MTELEGINQILESVGESPLDALGSGHPLEASAQRILEQTSRRIQSRGWWFNTGKITLEPAIDGRISIPAAYIQIDPTYHLDRMVHRGGFLYDLENQTDIIGRSVEVEYRELVAFVSLPETAAAYIAAMAALRFAKAYDADGPKIELLSGEAAQAMIPLQADQIRNADINMFAVGDTGRNLSYIRGFRYVTRYQ